MFNTLKKCIAFIVAAITMFCVVMAPSTANALEYKIVEFSCDTDVSITVVDNTMSEDLTMDEVPLFNQMDYPDVPYGGNSVATSGCGITCIAMIGSYLRDEAILPDELAKMFNDCKYSNIQRMEQASDYLELPYEKTTSWNTVYEALQNGQVAISYQSGGIFTGGGHLIVLTGVNEDGKVMVNDPYGYNWRKNAEMIDGFANGFTKSQVDSNCSMYWIYEAKKD